MQAEHHAKKTDLSGTPALRSPAKEMLAAWIVALVAIGTLVLFS